MKSHELAQKLLNGPNRDVMFRENCGCVLLVDSAFSHTIDEFDEEMCGDAEDRLGDEVVILCH